MTDTNFLLDDDLDEETANNNKNQTKSILDDLDLENESFAEKNNKNEANNDEGVVISKSKVVLINKLLKNIQETNEKIQKLLL